MFIPATVVTLLLMAATAVMSLVIPESVAKPAELTVVSAFPLLSKVKTLEALVA